MEVFQSTLLNGFTFKRGKAYLAKTSQNCLVTTFHGKLFLSFSLVNGGGKSVCDLHYQKANGKPDKTCWPKSLRLNSSRSTGHQQQMLAFIFVTRSMKWVRIQSSFENKLSSGQLVKIFRSNRVLNECSFYLETVLIGFVRFVDSFPCRLQSQKIKSKMWKRFRVWFSYTYSLCYLQEFHVVQF